jgi:hypothetical protein
MHIRIIRKLASLQYQRDPSQGFDWHNNDNNNALDTLEVYDDADNLTLTCAVQTVANLEGLDPGVHFYDTIAPGKFSLRYGVDPRSFKCQPFGVIGATTKHGDYIVADLDAQGKPTPKDSTTPTNPSRWLMHDRKDHTGVDTRVAWSAGCIVHQDDANLVAINKLCADAGMKSGDLIPCELIEEAND